MNLIWRLLLVAFLTSLAQGQLPSISKQVANADRVRFRITRIDNSTLTEINAPVLVEIENSGDEPISVSGLTLSLVLNTTGEESRFRVSPQEFWSPVDVLRARALAARKDVSGGWSYPDQKVMLPASSTTEVEINLRLLQWGSVTSSSLPNTGLFGIVPDGSYRLAGTLVYSTNSVSNKIRAPSVEVRIRRRE